MQKKHSLKMSRMLGFGLVLFWFINAGCKKFVEVDAPATSFNSEDVYATDATAISGVTSMYVKMSQFDIKGPGVLSTSYYLGLSSDELALYSGVTGLDRAIYTNSLTGDLAPNVWAAFYPIIYQANAALEGLNQSVGLTSIVKAQLVGEAKFTRAFCYFYLVNLYGNVPLVLTTDYKSNSVLGRTDSSQVWQQIIADFKDAEDTLSDKYPKSDLISYYANGAEERVRPTKWAAIAMLSRAYLYVGNWQMAEAEASKIINNPAQFGLSALNGVFLKNNKEAIWQFQPVGIGFNTNEAKSFILPPTGPNSTYPVYISKQLLRAFDSGDVRKTMWLNSVKVGVDTFYYPVKYKSATLNAPVTEYSMVLRVAEQYLIRAEARAQAGNLPGAIDDLNKIRERANLSLLAVTNPGITKSALLDMILHERQVELFTEWGHRWLDLKRTNKVDDVMRVETVSKGGTWDTHDKLYPIPNSEILVNPNLNQTPGY